MKVLRHLLVPSLVILLVVGIMLVRAPRALSGLGEEAPQATDTTLTGSNNSVPFESTPTAAASTDPKVRELVARNFPRAINGLEGFFEKHHVPPETQDRLIALLLIRWKTKSKVNADFQAGRYASKKAAEDWYRSECARIDGEFARSLAPDQRKDFQAAVGRISIRDNFTVAELSLARANASLTPQQGEDYIDAVYTYYTEYKLDPHFTLSLPHSSEEMRNYVRLRAVADARALQKLSSQLTAEQIRIIRTYQSNQINGMVARWNAMATRAQRIAHPTQ